MSFGLRNFIAKSNPNAFLGFKKKNRWNLSARKREVNAMV